MQRYRSLVLPTAIILGIFFHGYIALFRAAVPYLIFAMLLLNFSSLDVSKMKISIFQIYMIVFQIVASALSYFLILPAGDIMAQGAMIGFLCPVASAMVAVSCMLGANRETVTTYTLLDNVVIAFIAPLFFSFVGAHPDISFMKSTMMILSKITPIIVLPLIIALLMQRFAAKANDILIKHQTLSFYIWAVTLMLTFGQAIDFVFMHGRENRNAIIWLSIISLIICAIQFSLGRMIGQKYGDKIAGGQSLGQKNTALCIWMAYTYLHPLTSMVPAAYALWQNLFNSYQLFMHDRKK